MDICSPKAHSVTLRSTLGDPGCLDKRVMTRVHSSRIPRSGRSALAGRGAPRSPFPPSPQQPLMLARSPHAASPVGHTVGSAGAAGSGWPLSRSPKPQSFFRAFPWLRAHFPGAGSGSVVRARPCIRSPTEGRLGCFRALAVTSTLAPMSTCRFFIRTGMLRSFGKIPRIVIAASYGKGMF